MRIASVITLSLVVGCANQVEEFTEEGDDVAELVFEGDPEALYDGDGVAAMQEVAQPFMRLGVRYTAASYNAVELRTSADGETWSEWRAPELVFSEEGAHAGHIDVEGDAASFFQHRVTPGELPPTFVAFVALPAIPVEPPEDELGLDTAESSVEQGLNLDLRSRASWGARAPRCNSGSTGVKMATIHHTAGANDDSTPVPVQLRQIQAFHMFTRGWCDIGYNFLVSRDGRIWEGRGYGRMGAHVENANSNNMGISFIGTYTSRPPPVQQQIAAAKVLRYLHDRAGIPLRRDGADGVKGHRQRGTTVTTCPGDALYARLGDIVRRAKEKDFDEPAPVDPFALSNDEEAAIGLLHLVGPRSTTDVDGDGRQDICARNAQTIRCRLTDASGNWTRVIDGPDLTNEAGWVNAPRYETFRMADINGDGKADLCGRSRGGLRCWKSTGTGFGGAITKDIMSTQDGWAEPFHYGTIHMADVNGDGKTDLCGRRDAGFRCWLSNGRGFPTEINGPGYSDKNGWRKVEHFATIRMGDVNGDGKDDVCARNAAGMRCWLSNGSGFPTRVDGPAWSNSNGWNKVERWSTIQLVDVDNDGKADLCGRGATGFRCHLSRGTSFGRAIEGPALSDANGWNKAEHYATIRMGDIDGDGDLDVCGRGNLGVKCWKWNGSGFANGRQSGQFADDIGWTRAARYRTIRLADIDGDGKADLCGRGSLGVRCFTAASNFETEKRASQYSDDNGWNNEVYYGTLRL